MFTEDLTPFFSDFAVTATFGAYTGSVLFDYPDQIIGDGIVSAEYVITYPAGQYPNLQNNSTITVNGSSYRVNHVQAIGDGKLYQAYLSK